MTRPNIPIFIAIDDPDPHKAAFLSGRLPSHIGLKFGTTFIYANGLSLVKELAEGYPLIIDAKLHDIPSTMIRTANVIVERTGAQFITIHIEDNDTAIRQVRNAVDCDLVGVFALSHLVAWSGLWMGRLATAKVSGLSWVVCPGWALGQMPDGVRQMAVGIRTQGQRSDDHNTTIHPDTAVRLGARALIIGRAVTDAPDPIAALADIEASL
jgi:orotidine-5'-phosphate decarboxylase